MAQQENERQQIDRAVKKVRRSLLSEQFLAEVSNGLLWMLATALAVVVLSRLVVLPEYGRYAFVLACSAGVLAAVLLFRKRVTTKQAIRTLDRYLPDNLLLTAVDPSVQDSPFGGLLTERVVLRLEAALHLFSRRKRKKPDWRVAGAAVAAAVLLLLLNLFPSPAQQEARDSAAEKKVVAELKKKAVVQAEKAAAPDVKKKLEALAGELKKPQSSEQALKEFIKTQKELKLRQQQLAEKKAADADAGNAGQLTSEEAAELKELQKITSELADSGDRAYRDLASIGKAPSLPQLAAGAQNGDQNSNTSANSAGKSQSGGSQTGVSSPPGAGSGKPSGTQGTGSQGGGQSSGQQPGQGNSSQPGSSQGQNSGNGQGSSQGKGPGNGQGSGQGQGSGSSQGSGNGQGSGSGQGSGQGQGSGSGAGTGSGGRNLLAIPGDRLGKPGGTITDSSQLGKGDAVQSTDKKTDTRKGSLRPYEEVVGQYKDSYLKQTEQLPLSPELEKIVADYFSSIE